MKPSWALVVSLMAALVVCLANGRTLQHVSRRFDEQTSRQASASSDERSPQRPLGYVMMPSAGAVASRKGVASVSPHSNSNSASIRDSELEAESRGPFSDMLPYVGSFVYRTAVRRVLVKPMLKGMKRLIPPSAISYIKESMGNRRFFKMVSPLQPMVSTYAYNKFEQGVFWTLKSSFSAVKNRIFVSSDDEDDDERKKRSLQRSH